MNQYKNFTTLNPTISLLPSHGAKIYLGGELIPQIINLLIYIKFMALATYSSVRCTSC